MPDAQYHWGSNMVKAQIGNLNLMLAKYGIESQNQTSFLLKAKEHLHYFHGVNPINLVYLTNMYDLGGDYCANEMYHSWFADGTDYDHALNNSKGPAPGYLTGGPNMDFSVNTISPPYNQPPQKSYLDWNTSWPENSWEISEPAIYYQSAYIRLLAYFTQLESGETTATNIELSPDDIEILPNPMGDTFAIRGILVPYSIDIYTAGGSHVNTIENSSSEALIDISSLGPGMYILHIYHNSQTALHVEQIIKF